MTGLIIGLQGDLTTVISRQDELTNQITKLQNDITTYSN